MAIAHVTTGTALTGNAGTTTVTISYPGSLATGNMVLAGRNTKPASADNTAETGWTTLTNATGGTGAAALDAGQTKVWTGYHEVVGGEGASVTFDQSASPNSVAGCMIQYSKASSAVWDIASGSGDDATHGTGRSATCDTALSIGAGDVIVCFVGSDTDANTAWTSPAITATGMTITTTLRLGGATGNPGVSQGNDSGLAIFDGFVTAGTRATVAPALSLSGGPSNCGRTGFVRLREIAVVTGTAAASLGFSGTATGTSFHIVTGTAAGSLGFSGTATGTSTPAPAITQAAYRFYADGTETGSTALAAQDTGYTADTSGGDVNLQFRVRLQSTNAGAPPSTDDWQLQWEKTAGTGTLADSYPDTNQDASVAAGAGQLVGQSFLGNGQPLARVGFRLSRDAITTGTVTAYLYAHTGTFGTAGVGTGAALATSITTVPRSSLTQTTTPDAWYYFDFDSTYTLTNTTPYVLVVGAGGDTVRVAVDSSSGTHAGNRVLYNGSTWSANANDAIFEVYTKAVTTGNVASGGTVNAYASANLTDGAATTNRLGAGSGSFVAGKVSEDGLVDDLGWSSSNYTELLYSITLKQADLAPADTLRFRVLRNAATTTMTYSATPTITIGAAGPATITGTAAGSLAFTGTASGTNFHIVTGTAAGSLAISGTATGTRITFGTAAASVAVTGTATGTSFHVITGTAAASLAFSGTATGTVHTPVTGTAATSLAFSGAAAGTVHTPAIVTGTAAATLAISATATGTIPSLYTVIGQWGSQDIVEIQWGSQAVEGAWWGSEVWFPAVAANIVTGTASGSLAFTGAAAGTVHVCVDVLAEPFDNYTTNSWTFPVGTPTIVAGRHGTAGRLSTTNQAEYAIASPDRSNYLTVGFAYQQSSLTIARPIFEFHEAGTTQSSLYVDSTGYLEIRRSTTTSLGTGGGAGAIVINTWNYLEIQILHANAGTVIVRLNGTPIINLAGVDTLDHDTGTIDAVRIRGGGSSAAALFDDLYLTTGSGCAFQGDITVPSIITGTAAASLAFTGTATGTVHACAEVLEEPFDNTSAWTLTGSPTIVAGRHGTAVRIVNPSARANYTIPAPSESAELVIGFAWQISAFSGFNSNIVQLYSDTNATQHNRVYVESTGRINFTVGGIVVGFSATGAVTTATWHYIEVKAKLGDSPNGSCIVRVDGTEVINVSGTDTKNSGTKTAYDAIRLGPTTGAGTEVALYDDLYLTTGSGCSFQGDITVPSVFTGTAAGSLGFTGTATGTVITPPTIIGTATLQTSGTADRTVTVHASTATGDLILVVAVFGTSATTGTAPGGWTAIKTNIATGSLTTNVWAHVRAGGETTYPNFTVSGTTQSTHQSITIRGWQGTIANLVVGSDGTRAGSGGTFTVTAPTVSTSTIQNLVLALFTERTTATETGISSVNNSVTEYLWTGHLNLGIETIWIGQKVLAAAGATGATSVVYPNTQALNGFGFHLCIPPP